MARERVVGASPERVPGPCASPPTDPVPRWERIRKGVVPVRRSLRPTDLDRLPEAARAQIRAARDDVGAVKKNSGAPPTGTVPPRAPTAPHAPAPQPRAAAVEPDPPRSVFTRLWYWLTEEVPPDRPRRFVAVESPDSLRRFAARPAPPGPAPTKATAVAADRPGAARAYVVRVELAGRRRSRRDRRATRRWIVNHPWVPGAATVALLALVAVGVAALKPTGSVPPLPGRHAGAIHSTHNAPASPTPPASAPSAATPGQPNCASMQMQPVPPPSVSTHQPLPGLCSSLGDGRSWLVGCAPGFQTSCDPALPRVLSCLRQAGAAQSGVVTDANLRACAGVPSGSSAASAPSRTSAAGAVTSR